MKKCVIFCAAEFDSLLEPITPEDFVIAADGGVAHTQKLGLKPQVILGDFDSLGYIPQGAEVHPVEKDDTDAMLAVRLGLDRGAEEFLLYGGVDGPRLDHAVANFQTLAFLADRGARGYLVGRNQLITVLREGELHFPSGSEGTVSVFCLGEDARGVTLSGLKYTLEEGVLQAGFPLGVSNSFTGQPAGIRVRKGRLLIIWDRKAGLPTG